VKILLVSRGVFPVPVKSGAGAEAHMYSLANAIAGLGHEVHYVTNVSSHEKGEFHKNVILHRIEPSKIPANKSFYAYTLCHFAGNVRAFRTALKTLRNEKYKFDVIHSHGNLATLLLSYFKRELPLVYTIHDTPPYSCSYSSLEENIIHNASFEFIDLKAWRRSNHLICVSNNLGKEILKMGIPREKISAIYNGVDDEFLKERDHRKSQDFLRAKYGITSRYCLYVGRLAQRKGLDYLLRAIEKVGCGHCVIVGDGPQRKSLQSLAKNLQIQDRTIFTGFVPEDDLKNFYAAADFLILPSLAEGLPLVILEALALGVPVVATEVAGIPEIILDGYNGLVVPPRDADALSIAIKRLAADPELRKKMSAHARQTVGQKFSWRSVAQEVLRVYEKVCA
jgi:glycosyltransferase involved in cell wall biosynthesis